MKWYTGLQTVIKTGIYHQCAIREDRALRSFGPESILTCVGFHSVCLKLARCRLFESDWWGWELSNDEWIRKRGMSAYMGGYSFHWALPWPQVSFWSCRWWISLCWLVDEPWPGVMGFPFVCPPPHPCPLLHCTTPHYTPPPLPFTFPSPSELLLGEDFLNREGHSYVIVMQQGSAAWDDFNETAFSNEKLLWHVLKDKAPTLCRPWLKFFNR